ncbi:hypothetical protein, partial [Aeromonas jandaei]
VDHLVRNELLQRGYDKEDRRAVVIELTEKGKEVFTQVMDVYIQTASQYNLEDMESGVVTFMDFMKKLDGT